MKRTTICEIDRLRGKNCMSLFDAKRRIDKQHLNEAIEDLKVDEDLKDVLLALAERKIK